MGLIARQAVVIGASIAGLAAARALSPHFETVHVIERDEFSQTGRPRKAVPQGNHVHALLKSGELALEQLFPGLTEELTDCGAKRVDFSRDVRWYHGGQWKLRYDSGFHIMVQTRPLLEMLILRRVQNLGNVQFHNGCEVESLKTNPEKTKITGVVLQDMPTRSQKIMLECDLLVDASGRGSKMPQWLTALGYSAPAETRLKIDLTYSSRLYQAPEGKAFDWKLLVLNPRTPDVLRAGYIFPVENNHWLITYAGYSGEDVPMTNEGFLEYAQSLPQPDIYEHMQALTPLSDVKTFSVPYMIRRHYENTQMPEGLLVMGDAFCGFDPVFGQGMSAAAKEGAALSEMLAKTRSLNQFGKKFHKRAAQIVAIPWLLSSSEDFRYPKTAGNKPFFIPILHWYSNHIFQLSASDKATFEAFRQVMHLLEGVEALFKPQIVLKVLKHAVGQ